ncbi:MFS transporter, partial [Ascoidea rubescens DSM 1968]
VKFQGHDVIIDSDDIKENNLLKIQVILSYLSFIIFGLSDQTIGVLIPVFVKDYEMKESTISLLYFAQFFGYFIISVFNDYLHRLMGFHGVLVTSVGLIGTCSFIGMFKPPFFVLIIGYVLCGIGVGAQDAAVGVWLGKLKYSNELSGLLHASYGVGCIVTPIFVTKVLLNNNISWRYHYLIIFMLAMVVSIIDFFVFKHESKWKYRFQVEENKSEENESENDGNANESSGIRNAIKNKKVLGLALFLFLYVGTEVSIGAWTLSYLIKIKNGTMDQMSVVISMFWFGLTLGRIVLGFVTPKLSSEYLANMIYESLSIVFFVLFCLGSSYWLFIATVFLTGVFIGPIFPTTTIYSVKILPVQLHVSGVGFAMALGGGGAAVLPWLMGNLCELWGSFRLYPYFVVLFL